VWCLDLVYPASEICHNRHISEDGYTQGDISRPSNLNCLSTHRFQRRNEASGCLCISPAV
jgi:hypothetical protein